MKKKFMASLLVFALIFNLISSFSVYASEFEKTESLNPDIIQKNENSEIDSLKEENIDKKDDLLKNDKTLVEEENKSLKKENKLLENRTPLVGENDLLMMRAPQNQGTIKISSFEDLKAYLELKDSNTVFNIDLGQRLFLKPGNYELANDFVIDLEDSFFADKKEFIKYGIISANEDFSLNANGHTISFKQNDAVALFGAVDCPNYRIENLKVSYPSDVSGFAFAQILQASNKSGAVGFAKADGYINNVEINVGGDVLPLPTTEQMSNHFIGNYKGKISTGFAWYIQNSNLDNITINVNGNIGDTNRPQNGNDMVAAYGLTHHFGNVSHGNQSETWKELHNNGNVEVLRDIGHVINLNINVGGNIQAYGYNTGYSAGIGQDMASCWIENANINIKGDIVTDLSGNSADMKTDYSSPYAFGLSDELMNFTGSSLEVNNIIFKAENIPTNKINMVGAVANNNSHGNYTNISNNTIRVNGKIEGSSNSNLLASIGFNNDWDTNGGTDSNGKMISNGVNWIQVSENNTYNIGDLDLKSESRIDFHALGKRFRTGQKPLGSLTIPEASLNNNALNVGDINVEAKVASNVYLLMYNSSNAKNNTLNYGNISINSPNTNFCGMGHLSNEGPETNAYTPLTENNNITIKDLNITSDETPYVSLMVGYQDKEQAMKNCSVKAGKVNVTINKGDKTSYIGGMAGYSQDKIDSCRVFVDSIDVENKGDKNLYFGLGAGSVSNSNITNSGVFVDSNINIKAKNLFGGGFVGYGNKSSFSGNDLQIDGENNILSNGYYGGFAGFLRNSKLNNNSSLLLSDFTPFTYYADNNTNIDKIAHYVNGKAPQYFSGLIASGDGTATIKNSTLLVEKDFEDTILYPKNILSSESKDNYLVVVDNTDDFNRKAYKTSETTATEAEMGGEIPVFKKTGDPIGKINISKRSFQDKYWNENINPYELTDEEKDFDYMTANQAGTISVFGLDSNQIINKQGSKGKLFDYYHRHAGLVSGDGVVYDLLGIKGNSVLIVIYDRNGADGGSVPIDSNKYKSGDGVTVLDKGDLSRAGYEFIGWNTRADGSGTSYKAKDVFKVFENTTLYAQWKKIEEPEEPEKPDQPEKPDKDRPSYSSIWKDNDSILNKEDHYQYLIGYEDETFRPENNMTRQEVTVMFSRLLKNRPQKGKIYSRDYKDTPDDLWSITGISYMSMLNIIKGYPDGNFRPESKITRAEFAAIAARFDKLTGGNKTFTDVSSDHWAYEEIQKAAAAGWISGYPDGSFKPDQAITRAEVVTITNRMLNRYADQAYVDSHKDQIIYYKDIDKSHWAYYPVVEASNGHDFERKSNGKDELWFIINDKSFVYDK